MPVQQGRGETSPLSYSACPSSSPARTCCRRGWEAPVGCCPPCLSSDPLASGVGLLQPQEAVNPVAKEMVPPALVYACVISSSGISVTLSFGRITIFTKIAMEACIPDKGTG